MVVEGTFLPARDSARCRGRSVLRWATFTCAAVAAQLLALANEGGKPAGAMVSEAAASPVAASGTEATGCGTRRILKRRGVYWRCSFADNFGGDRLNTAKWSRMVTATSGFRSGRECYPASGSNVLVRHGQLRLTVRERAGTFLCQSPKGSYRTKYTGGSVTTWQKFSQAYGRFEIRAKFPRSRTSGLHSALWLWPQSASYGTKWPASGEIDIAEHYTRYPDRAVPYVHYIGDTLDPTRTNTRCMISRPWEFHTYTLVWTPQRMILTYDGKTCLVNEWKPLLVRRPAPFDQPFVVNLTQALGIFPNPFSPTRTPLPATMQVDHVRVWN